jgi:EpsI family protein
MKVSRQALIAGIAMFLSAILAWAMTPTKKVADERPPLELETIFPSGFGSWRIDPNVVPLTVSPDVQAQLDKLYSRTLARTYVNEQGERVMLSVAYGGDQSDALQVHRPEVCYTAQGFQVLKEVVGELATQYGALPVKRLLAVSGRRQEPITYWVTVGDQATYGGMKQKLIKLKYGLTGKVPDGMLVRVSTISSDPEKGYEVQGAFLKDMLGAMDPKDRLRIAGSFGA